MNDRTDDSSRDDGSCRDCCGRCHGVVAAAAVVGAIIMSVHVDVAVDIDVAVYVDIPVYVGLCATAIVDGAAITLSDECRSR